ncbi:MAG: TlpA disulfide reductase family protein, partial [Candidatus Adiutricales bacterium]
LNFPKSKSDREYLGLKQEEPFTLSQIPSKLVLIEVFSTLCKVCFKTAPNVNKLFKFILRDSDLASNLKMIGVGVGDTDKKVAVWKTQMRVRFPLFSDPKRVAFKKFGGPGTPYTVLIDNRSGKVLFTHGGALNNVEEFLGELKEFNERH